MLEMKDLKKLQKKFERLTIETPTSELRNTLSLVSIILLSHIEVTEKLEKRLKADEDYRKSCLEMGKK